MIHRFRQGHTARNVGVKSLCCVFLPYLLLGMMCRLPASCVLCVVEITQGPVCLAHHTFPSFPSPVVHGFPDRSSLVPESPVPGQVQVLSSLCCKQFSAPPWHSEPSLGEYAWVGRALPSLPTHSAAGTMVFPKDWTFVTSQIPFLHPLSGVLR